MAEVVILKIEFLVSTTKIYQLSDRYDTSAALS